ncbi:MAG: hypothetical protein ACD_21C00092G0001 [uncultured bacterium]|nr:MAG: hypothetical protein ACD_21C00092G0001 [uncultured bacterium]
MLIVGFVLFFVAYWHGKVNIQKGELKAGYWLMPYLTGLVLISYLGSFGGKHFIPFGWDFIIIALFSAAILCTAIWSRALITVEEVEEYLIAKTGALVD